MHNSTVPLTILWDHIDWDVIKNKVYQIQTRIVKYLKQGKKWLAKKLQRLLVNSFYNILLAIKRIMSNKGSKTPGVDGKLLKTREEQIQLAYTIKTQTRYRPQPLKRILIPKKNGKRRPLGIPTMFDRAMQAVYKSALEPVAEYYADGNSYGFRPKRSTADAIQNCYQMVCRKNNAKWILEGDIKGCFDNFSHTWLLENIPINKTILRKWLRSGYVYKNRLFPVKSGTPQGGIISPILANMALDGLESILKDKFRGCKVNYTRYADDFIITGRSKGLLENRVKPVVIEFLKGRGLQLSEEKTVITHISKGFDFLGFNIRSYNGKVLTKPAKKNIKAVTAKIKKIIQNNKQTEQGEIIGLLNPVIRGWGNYYSHAVSKRTFTVLDHKIWLMLWKWARRRHRNKNAKWIRERYFKRVCNRELVFKTEEKTLVEMAKIPIKRHIKIRKDANPYDTEYIEYLKRRSHYHMYKDSMNVHLE
jgi:RNA-directed DNA polymerase